MKNLLENFCTQLVSRMQTQSFRPLVLLGLFYGTIAERPRLSPLVESVREHAPMLAFYSL